MRGFEAELSTETRIERECRGLQAKLWREFPSLEFTVHAELAEYGTIRVVLRHLAGMPGLPEAKMDSLFTPAEWEALCELSWSQRPGGELELPEPEPRIEWRRGAE